MRKKAYLVIVFLFWMMPFVYSDPCPQGEITGDCECEGKTYNSGYCCYSDSANAGIWFDKGYKQFCNGCPSGNFYFVDGENTSASDQNPGTENNPWKTLQKACDTAQAGDVVLVKPGRYIGEQIGSYRKFSPANSGTKGNPIVFKSYPKHQAIIGEGGGPNQAMMIYVVDYIIIDGFKIEGRITLDGEPNNHCEYDIIRNCDVSYGYYPPSDPSLNWGIFVNSARDCIIENNYVHDLTDSGNHSHNTAYIMVFNSVCSSIIQHNFVDSKGVEYVWSAYGQKGGNLNENVWRYNFSKDVPHGFLGMASTDGQAHSLYDVYHNNLVIGARSGFFLDHGAQYFRMYNNTIYNCDQFINIGLNDNTHTEIWNNIISSVNHSAIRWAGYPEANAFSLVLDYSDYNCFHNYPMIAHREKSPTLRYYNLSDWRSSGVLGKGSFPDMHSIDANPLFVNDSGIYSEKEDFILSNSSPCMTAGRFGGRIGADISMVGIKEEGNIDNDAPVVLDYYPRSNLPSGAVSTILIIDTNEPAECKYTDEPGINFENMEGEFDNGCSIHHTKTITGLSDGETKHYYIKCMDWYGNINSEDFEVSFSVGNPSYVDSDVNQDSYVDISDVQLVVNVILGMATNSRADVNGNGSTDISDVQAVVNEIVD